MVDSRETQEGRVIRRRRECEACQGRFSTYEEAEVDKIIVVKRDGEKEEFSREKVGRGLWRAFEKRPQAEEKIEKILNGLEMKLHQKKEQEVASREIGNIILTLLKQTDEVAYIRFASVYKSFGSVKSFYKALESLEDLAE